MGFAFCADAGPANSQSAAGSLSKQLQDAGYPAQVVQRKVGEKALYTVRIRQLPSRDAAHSLAGQLKGRFGVTDPRVGG